MPTQYLPALMYAGLAGTVLALIVATGQNKWSPRVFFLLALRLSIGWHFLFEGLHKVHSDRLGVIEMGTPSVTTNRPFSSEPYFKVAPGPLGEKMRKTFSDPEAVFADRVRPAKDISPTAFDALPIEQQAEACPASVASKLDVPLEKVVTAIKAEAAADKKAVDAAEKKGLADAEAEIKQFNLKDKQAEAEKDAVKKKAAKTREVADKVAASAEADAPKRVLGAKAAYAAWVYGADRRDVTLKFISSPAPLSAPERFGHINRLRGMLGEEEAKLTADLGQGSGLETKRIGELRTEIIAAEAALAKDADDYVADLRKALGDDSKDEPAKSLGKQMDGITMWFLVGVGACLMGGLLTRLACVLAAGFLVMTYLAHPPFPWYPLPPNTEGNPVFINKNVIEAIALLTIATFPTGRWLGLDAVIGRVCCRTRPDDSAVA